MEEDSDVVVVVVGGAKAAAARVSSVVPGAAAMDSRTCLVLLVAGCNDTRLGLEKADAAFLLGAQQHTRTASSSSSRVANNTTVSFGPVILAVNSSDS